MKRSKVLFSTIIVLAALLYAPRIVTPAHAATGVVCPIPTTGSSCLSSPASITGTVGTQLRVSVFIQNSAGLNGFDITLLADHTILKPAGVDLTGSVLPPPQQIIPECIGGVLQPGSSGSCSPTDTPDTIHLGVVVAGFISSSPTTGLLFTAIYNVTASSTGTPIGFQTGCSNTSVPPSTCVTIENGGIMPVPETVQTAIFSTSGPDYSATATPTSLTLQRSSVGTSSIVFTSISGFTGQINLSSSISSTKTQNPTIALNTTRATLTAGGTASVTLTITTLKNTAFGSFTITITGTSGSISHSVTVSLTVSH